MAEPVQPRFQFKMKMGMIFYVSLSPALSLSLSLSLSVCRISKIDPLPKSKTLRPEGGAEPPLTDGQSRAPPRERADATSGESFKRESEI